MIMLVQDNIIMGQINTVSNSCLSLRRLGPLLWAIQKDTLDARDLRAERRPKRFWSIGTISTVKISHPTPTLRQFLNPRWAAEITPLSSSLP